MFRTLVTGGLGFIGSHLVDYLCENNHEVTIIDNLTSNILPKEQFDSLAETYVGDVADFSFLQKVCSGRRYDYVYHLAAHSSVPLSVTNDSLSFSSNVIGTYNMVKTAIRMESKFVFASSCTVYGYQGKNAASEEDKTTPISPYGLSKLVDESICLSYGRIYGFDSVCFRFFNVYGRRQKGSVIPDFLKKLSRGRGPIKMLGTGNEVRDFVNVKDVLRALVLPLREHRMWNEVFNVGTGKGTAIRDLVSIILGELHSTREISYSGISRKGDMNVIYADLRKIEKFGFTPTVDLRAGVKETIEDSFQVSYVGN